MRLEILVKPIDDKAPDWRLYIIEHLRKLLKNDVKVKTFEIKLIGLNPEVVFIEE